MGETVIVKCIECFAAMRVDKQLRSAANSCDECVRRYREKFGTKSRVKKRGKP